MPLNGSHRWMTTAKPSIPERKKIVLDDKELIETFVKGSGPGGQCINKRVSCVDLRHIPTGTRSNIFSSSMLLQCQQTRSLQENRGIARKLMREKLDDLFNGTLSKNAQKAAKVSKQKARSARRSKKKY
ncbi:peptide chain release factor class I/class II, partial [Phycomyces blakesleeanus]